MPMTPFALTAITLCASLAGNGLLAWAYLGQRDAATHALAKVSATTVERDNARADAAACSDATDDLRELAEKRKQEAELARQQANIKATAHDERADTILATPQAVPGDACASAQALIDDWLKGKALP